MLRCSSEKTSGDRISPASDPTFSTSSPGFGTRWTSPSQRLRAAHPATVVSVQRRQRVPDPRAAGEVGNGLSGAIQGPVVLAGPSCDSADVLYEHSGYQLPIDLLIGDQSPSDVNI